MENGKDIIEMPTALGGIFVDDETIQVAADMEVVASDHFHDFKAFNVALLTEINRAIKNELDPFEEIKLWLDSFNEIKN